MRTALLASLFVASFMIPQATFVGDAQSSLLKACKKCTNMECSGRHIRCRGWGIGKLTCEIRKSEWKGNCELRKSICYKTCL